MIDRQQIAPAGEYITAREPPAPTTSAREAEKLVLDRRDQRAASLAMALIAAPPAISRLGSASALHHGAPSTQSPTSSISRLGDFLCD